ncbi:hypothetical protein [Streptacidiphilus sp. EB103A]|uniref:hypothetical protein n=1 Tax=Streptacidiphilus sp. EB103A TaxID=3156275 RepID=UPI003515725A
MPWTLASKTQLATADLPRRPGGPVRGYVAGVDFRGRRTEVPLYTVADCPPTTATGRQLAAAADRRSAVVRTCSDCGARTQLPLTERRGRYLCAMCNRVARVIEDQIELRRRRIDNAVWAHDLLEGGEDLALVWVQVLDAPAAGDRPARAAVAARVQAVDQRGRPLKDLLIKLTGPRTPGAPKEALASGEGAAALALALAERRPVVWGPLQQVLDRLAALGHHVPLTPGAGQGPAGTPHRYRPDWSDSPDQRYRQWRGELDPATGELLTPWPPGSADRLWLCLTRMADSADEGRPGRSAGEDREDAELRHGPRPCQDPEERRTRIAVTGSAQAGRHVAELLTAGGEATGLRATAPVPSREQPGRVVTTLTIPEPTATESAPDSDESVVSSQVSQGTPGDFREASAEGPCGGRRTVTVGDPGGPNPEAAHPAVPGRSERPDAAVHGPALGANTTTRDPLPGGTAATCPGCLEQPPVHQRVHADPGAPQRQES